MDDISKITDSKYTLPEKTFLLGEARKTFDLPEDYPYTCSVITGDAGTGMQFTFCDTPTERPFTAIDTEERQYSIKPTLRLTVKAIETGESRKYDLIPTHRYGCEKTDYSKEVKATLMAEFLRRVNDSEVVSTTLGRSTKSYKSIFDAAIPDGSILLPGLPST